MCCVERKRKRKKKKKSKRTNKVRRAGQPRRNEIVRYFKRNEWWGNNGVGGVTSIKSFFFFFFKPGASLSRPLILENSKSKMLSSNGWRCALPEMIIGGDGLLEIPKESITPISLNASTSLPTRVSRQKALELGERKALETKSWKTEE